MPKSTFVTSNVRLIDFRSKRAKNGISHLKKVERFFTFSFLVVSEKQNRLDIVKNTCFTKPE